MALVPLATKGNYFHIYDFRVKPGQGDEFVELFNKFDYGENNTFHRSRTEVKDGVPCRDAPDHFYLIGEWADIEEHRRIRELVAREIKPEFVQLIEGGHFVPSYAQIVSMTPLLDVTANLAKGAHQVVNCYSSTRSLLSGSLQKCLVPQWCRRDP